MRKLRRITLIAFATVIALAGALLLGVNLYVQSQGTQAKIQQELSRRLGTTLEIRSMSVTPWGGLQLSGIIIPQTSPAAPRHFLEAKTFRLRVRFLSLFSRRLVIDQAPCRLAARRGRKVEITQVARSAVVWSFSKTAGKRFPVATRRRIRPADGPSYGYCAVDESFSASSAFCRQ